MTSLNTLVHIGLVVCFLFHTVSGVAAQQDDRNETDPLTSAERSWLAEHPVIRVRPTPDYHPTEFRDEQGVHRGITAEFMALIEQRLNIQFTVVWPVQPFNEEDDATLMETDVVPLSAETPERLKEWFFTKPYLSFPAHIIVRNDFSDSLEMKDLEGMNVAVVNGYAAHEYLRSHHPGINIIPVANTEIGLRKTSFGMVDAFISDLPVATYYTGREGITNLRVAGDSGFVYQMGISTRRDLPVLHGILEKGLALITPEERQAIYDRWVTMPLSNGPTNHNVLLGLSIGLGVVAVLTLVTFLWNRTLRRQIAIKTKDLEIELADRSKREEHLQLLMRELDHRVKNNLASVLSLARTASRESRTIEQYIESFTGRLSAMARTHESLAGKKWEGISLHEGARLSLETFRSGAENRITLEGDNVVLNACNATPVTLALHELATNSQKYGALSDDQGHVNVIWNSEEDMIHLQWIERDGPSISNPTSKGFGLQLIDGLIKFQLKGNVEMEFSKEGLRCLMSFPK